MTVIHCSCTTELSPDTDDATELNTIMYYVSQVIEAGDRGDGYMLCRELRWLWEKLDARINSEPPQYMTIVDENDTIKDLVVRGVESLLRGQFNSARGWVSAAYSELHRKPTWDHS